MNYLLQFEPYITILIYLALFAIAVRLCVYIITLGDLARDVVINKLINKGKL